MILERIIQCTLHFFAMPATRKTGAQPAPVLQDITPATTPAPKGKKKKVTKKNNTPSHQRDEHNTNDLLMQIMFRLDGIDTNMAGVNTRLNKVEENGPFPQGGYQHKPGTLRVTHTQADGESEVYHVQAVSQTPPAPAIRVGGWQLPGRPRPRDGPRQLPIPSKAFHV